jgi:hypothetical protein
LLEPAGPAAPAVPPPGDGEERHLEPVEGAFSAQFVGPGALPPDVQLVGAGNAEASEAMLRLRQGEQGFLDRQRSAVGVQLAGQEQVFRGRHYHLSRDAGGRAVVQFQLGGVLHELTWEDRSGRIGAPIDVRETEFAHLVELADHLLSRGAMRD